MNGQPRLPLLKAESAVPNCKVIAAFLVLFAPFLKAQTVVQGDVRDRSGAPMRSAMVELRRKDASFQASQQTGVDGHFLFSAMEAGEYVLQATEAEFYSASYELVVRQRQPIQIDLVLEHRQSASQQVRVQEQYLTVDPEKTGSSYTFTSQDLEHLPDPLVESTNDLVNNLMPGASDSHDNFLAVRGTEFSLHEFINEIGR